MMMSLSVPQQLISNDDESLVPQHSISNNDEPPVPQHSLSGDVPDMLPISHVPGTQKTVTKFGVNTIINVLWLRKELTKM